MTLFQSVLQRSSSPKNTPFNHYYYYYYYHHHHHHQECSIKDYQEILTSWHTYISGEMAFSEFPSRSIIYKNIRVFKLKGYVGVLISLKAFSILYLQHKQNNFSWIG
jgi:hypothetical protein